jgi:hypothetical protein
MTDKLKAKLPPTDCRLRMDMRLWEEGKLEEATEIKNKLEVNQRLRKKALKEQLGEKVSDKDSDYYNPLYFKAANHYLNDEPYFEFVQKNKWDSNYWQDRDKSDWSHLPKIWEDDCKPFY